MAIRLGEGVPHLGPPVYLDEEVRAEYRPEAVDVVRIGENVTRDFSEISQSEWEKSQIYLTDKLHPWFGGFSAHVSPLRDSFIARGQQYAASRMKELANGFPYKMYPTFKELEQMGSDEVEDPSVLTVVNLATTVKGPVNNNRRFFPSDERLDVSTILAHELQHTANHLLEDRFYEERKDDFRVAFRLGAGKLGAALGGYALSIAGFMTAVDHASPWDGSAVATGAGVTLAGVAAMAAPSYLAERYDLATRRGLKEEEPELAYGGGCEDAANAYALATGHHWMGVIRVSPAQA